MGIKKIKLMVMMMVTTIVVITLFQAYWIKKNYEEESETLKLKTGILFREMLTNLQATKLVKLSQHVESKEPKNRLILNPRDLKIDSIGKSHRINVVRIANSIRNDLRNSSDQQIKPDVIIGVNGRTQKMNPEMITLKPSEFSGNTQIFYLLQGLDSLQDSTSLDEITQAFDSTLATVNLPVEFSVMKLDRSVVSDREAETNEFTIGFTNPVTYKLALGSNFIYILKRISLPLVFSFFIVAVTIVSFFLMYRSLLQQTRLAESKNEFISNITHELKTPIATVGVAIEAIKNFNVLKDPDRTREYLDISSNELQRLSMMVDKVLKQALFEKNLMSLNLEKIDILIVINEVVDSMRLQMEKLNIHFTMESSGDFNMEADPLHLQSVVYNLLDNAIKYRSADPHIQLDMTEDENTISFTVSDNGPGIAPEFTDKIFEKFFRVPTGNTHNAKGYGLGLSYAAHVVKQHTGQIKVESTPGTGSRFIVSLPRHPEGKHLFT